MTEVEDLQRRIALLEADAARPRRFQGGNMAIGNIEFTEVTAEEGSYEGLVFFGTLLLIGIPSGAIGLWLWNQWVFWAVIALLVILIVGFVATRRPS